MPPSRMSPSVIAQIISEVSKNPLIYDYTLVDYKDMHQKNLVWREIANKVGVKSGELIAWKWKHLRDSYAKYKKHLLYPPIDKNGQRSGLINWRWAPLMTFLEPYMRRPRDPDELHDSQNESQTEQIEEVDSKALKSALRESPELLIEANTRSCSPLTSISKNEIGKASTSRKRKYLETIDEVTVEPFQLEKSFYDKLDMTDFLFLSYAETFKKLDRKRQALLKLKMAQIFTEAELEELENDPIKCSNANYVSD